MQADSLSQSLAISTVWQTEAIIFVLSTADPSRNVPTMVLGQDGAAVAPDHSRLGPVLAHTRAQLKPHDQDCQNLSHVQQHLLDSQVDPSATSLHITPRIEEDNTYVPGPTDQLFIRANQTRPGHVSTHQRGAPTASQT